MASASPVVRSNGSPNAAAALGGANFGAPFTFGFTLAEKLILRLTESRSPLAGVTHRDRGAP
jgi:hypothetical protein